MKILKSKYWVYLFPLVVFFAAAFYDLWFAGVSVVIWLFTIAVKERT